MGEEGTGLEEEVEVEEEELLRDTIAWPFVFGNQL
jgi:hypothetical protein